MDGDARAAATLLLVEKLEDIVEMQVEAISNLKIDKITVWDSGSNGEGGSSTANFISGLFKSLPPLQDISTMAGLELPDYLGNVIEEGAKNLPSKEKTTPKTKSDSKAKTTPKTTKKPKDE